MYDIFLTLLQHIPHLNIFLSFSSSASFSFSFIYPSDPLGVFLPSPFIILVDFSTEESLHRIQPWQVARAVLPLTIECAYTRERERENTYRKETGTFTLVNVCVCVCCRFYYRRKMMSASRLLILGIFFSFSLDRASESISTSNTMLRQIVVPRFFLLFFFFLFF